MDHPIALHLPSKVFCALVAHAGDGGYGPKAEAALCDLIRNWIATTEAAPRPWADDEPDGDDGARTFTKPPLLAPAAVATSVTATAVSRGYQWKQVFLPNGTELRAIHAGRSTYAKVEDEQILSDGAPTTPSRLANLRGCGTRNAWRTVWLRFPGAPRWRRAADCRR
ncbi:hypothetical protein GTP44_09430 [Duganella sp. FT50W]|uniref:Uncharacterized protein n=1 Tax=Duganella lactea TaxID=2692173 RepID=A0A6L8MIU9_9BURK|nr:hypothetical protein [Duganella lactea]MYM82171.1 hypothetical protein [Duganella lactea]